MAATVRGEATMGERRDSDLSVRRDTHRGLGEVEASFTPSDPSELAPDSSGRAADAFDFHFPSDARLPSIPDDGRPVDELAMGATESPDRRRFATATGGGSNRVSGGRDVARAYVAPMTPAPVHLRTPDTISVEVSETFNQFDTIPSINRRRLAESNDISELLARPARNRLRRAIWIGALAIVGGIGVGLVVRALGEEEPAGDPEAKLSASLPTIPQEVPAVAAPPSAPKAEPVAATDPEAEPQILAPPSEAVAPESAPTKSSAASSSDRPPAASSKTTKKPRSGDLWLE